MQFGDVPYPLLGADPEGLVRDVKDGVGFQIREPRRLCVYFINPPRGDS